MTNQQSWVVVHSEAYPKTSASSLCLCLCPCGGGTGGGGDGGGVDPGWVFPECSPSGWPPGAAVGPQWRLSASSGWHQGQTEGGGSETEREAHWQSCLTQGFHPTTKYFLVFMQLKVHTMTTPVSSTWSSLLVTHTHYCMHWDTPVSRVWLISLMQMVYWHVKIWSFYLLHHIIKGTDKEKALHKKIIWTCIRF